MADANKDEEVMDPSRKIKEKEMMNSGSTSDGFEVIDAPSDSSDDFPTNSEHNFDSIQLPVTDITRDISLPPENIKHPHATVINQTSEVHVSASIPMDDSLPETIQEKTTQGQRLDKTNETFFSMAENPEPPRNVDDVGKSTAKVSCDSSTGAVTDTSDSDTKTQESWVKEIHLKKLGPQWVLSYCGNTIIIPLKLARDKTTTLYVDEDTGDVFIVSEDDMYQLRRTNDNKIKLTSLDSADIEQEKSDVCGAIDEETYFESGHVDTVTSVENTATLSDFTPKVKEISTPIDELPNETVHKKSDPTAFSKLEHAAKTEENAQDDLSGDSKHEYLETVESMESNQLSVNDDHQVVNTKPRSNTENVSRDQKLQMEKSVLSKETVVQGRKYDNTETVDSEKGKSDSDKTVCVQQEKKHGINERPTAVSEAGDYVKLVKTLKPAIVGGSDIMDVVESLTQRISNLSFHSSAASDNQQANTGTSATVHSTAGCGEKHGQMMPVYAAIGKGLQRKPNVATGKTEAGKHKSTGESDTAVKRSKLPDTPDTGVQLKNTNASRPEGEANVSEAGNTPGNKNPSRTDSIHKLEETRGRSAGEHPKESATLSSQSVPARQRDGKPAPETRDNVGEQTKLSSASSSQLIPSRQDNKKPPTETHDEAFQGPGAAKMKAPQTNYQPINPTANIKADATLPPLIPSRGDETSASDPDSGTKVSDPVSAVGSPPPELPPRSNRARSTSTETVTMVTTSVPAELPPRSNRARSTSTETVTTMTTITTPAPATASASVPIHTGWEYLMFQILWNYGHKTFSFDASADICPIKLQYALTGRMENISVEALDKQNIEISREKNAIIFKLEGTEFRNCDEVTRFIIKTINEHVLNEIGLVCLMKSSRKCLEVLEALKHAPPEKILKNYVNVFQTQSNICLVGKKESLDKVVEELNIEVKPTARSASIVVHHKLELMPDELSCFKTLEFIKYLQEMDQNVEIDFTTGELIGSQQDIDKALVTLEQFKKRLVHRKVTFKHKDCAKIFLDENGEKNDNVYAFITKKLLQKNLIKASYLTVSEGGNMPEVTVVCMDESNAQNACKIVSDCVDIHKFKPTEFDSDEAKKILNKWNQKNKVRSLDGDQEYFHLICTSDLSKIIQYIHDRILAANTVDSFPCPPMIFKFFSTFGADVIEDIEERFDVKIAFQADDNKLSMKGSNENLKQAKTFYKQELHKRMTSMTLKIPDATFSQCLIQMDKVITNNECCQMTKYDSETEEQLVKNGSYIATWYNPGNKGKVTLIEGHPAELDVDLLVLLVSDSLFPLHPDFTADKKASEAYLTETKNRVENTSYSIGEAVLVQYPKSELRIHSKETICLVVYKTQKTQWAKELNLTEYIGNIMNHAYTNKCRTVGFLLSWQQELDLKLDIIRDVPAAVATYFEHHDDVTMEVVLCCNKHTRPVEAIVESLDKIYSKMPGFARKLHKDGSILSRISSDSDDWQKVEQTKTASTEVTIKLLAKTPESLEKVRGEIQKVIPKADRSQTITNQSQGVGVAPAHSNDDGKRFQTTTKLLKVGDVSPTNSNASLFIDSKRQTTTKASQGNVSPVYSQAPLHAVKDEKSFNEMGARPKTQPAKSPLGDTGMTVDTVPKATPETDEGFEENSMFGDITAEVDSLVLKNSYDTEWLQEIAADCHVSVGSSEQSKKMVSESNSTSTESSLLADEKYEHYKSKETIRKAISINTYQAMNVLLKKEMEGITTHVSGMSYSDGEICIQCKPGQEELVGGVLENILYKMHQVQQSEMSLDANEMMLADGVVAQVFNETDDVYCFFVPNEGTIVTMAFDCQRMKEAEIKIKKKLGRHQQSSTRSQRQFETRQSLQIGYTETEGASNKVQRSLSRSSSHDGYNRDVNGVTVRVYEGDITKLQVDCIVNAANESLNSSMGVAWAISRAAGNAYEVECRSLAQTYGKLKIGEICETTAGKLPCKCVIQAVGSSFYYNMGKERRLVIVKETILKCLDHADGRGFSSIALPSIAAGATGLSIDDCALQYCSAVSEFSPHHQNISEVHFVDINKATVDKIKSAFTDLQVRKDSIKKLSQSSAKQSIMSLPWTPSSTSTALSGSLSVDLPNTGTVKQTKLLYSDMARSQANHSHMMGHASTIPDPTANNRQISSGYNTRSKAKSEQAAQHAMSKTTKSTEMTFAVPNSKVTLMVITGDIVSHQADAIISIEDKRFTGTAAIAREIKKRATDLYRYKHSRLYSENQHVTKTEVAITPSYGGQLLCKYVIQAIAPRWGWVYTQEAGLFERDLRLTVKHILQKTADMKLNSIALPFLGTCVPADVRLYPTPVERSCKSIVQSILEWARSHTETSVSKITLVCIEPAICTTFADVMEKEIAAVKEVASTVSKPTPKKPPPPTAAPTPKQAPKLPDKAPVADQKQVIKDDSKIHVVADNASQTSLCEQFVIGQCRNQSCRLLHSNRPRLPYVWQVKLHNAWVNIDQSEAVEMPFCEAREKKCHVTIKDEIGISQTITICFEPDISGVSSLGDKLSTRRLSTKSYAAPKVKAGSFVTRWLWYWRDDMSSWQLFDTDAMQYTLECKFLYGQANFLYSRDNYRFNYALNFTGMQQLNLDTGKVRKITRRPTFVSGSVVKSQNMSSKDRLVSIATAPVPLPSGWAPWDLAHPFELVELDPGHPDYIAVEKSFFQTLLQHNEIIDNIYRVQCPALWNKFFSHRKSMVAVAERAGRGANIDERKLFHATDCLDTVRGICINNFDPRVSGKNGTVYGDGAYFAKNSKYSHAYSGKDPSERFVFQAIVLIGDFVVGNSSYRRPPGRPGAAHELYDSCVNKIDNPDIFVIFDRDQYYPEYLIQYHDRPRSGSGSTTKPGSFQPTSSSSSPALSYPGATAVSYPTHQVSYPATNPVSYLTGNTSSYPATSPNQRSDNNSPAATYHKKEKKRCCIQ